MRCSGWSSLAISVCSALFFVGSAAAHVVATPAYLPSKSSESIIFEVPNERSEAMTSFTVTAPDGLEIEHAHPTGGWTGVTDGSSATWSDGSLAAGAIAYFGVTLKAEMEPGSAALEADQHYDSGAAVNWPVPITVTPAAESPSQNLALAGIVGLIGVLVVVAIAMLAWRRRAS